ncbi:ABC transporter ATP-binding protein [Lachnospira multipara]|uniref:ABC-type multidrug transport system, ATPase and permease component n=1 Tax=Lachnospira multipara TaxID=28051 RepID=A0A1H5TPV6_9FIRM|nr:ABC transporter ATP-binding protein [Lachnospira multipara]SEF64826.1 ABC-type multidrug transport system, ATPase and permease component [Lachnospira multipara]
MKMIMRYLEKFKKECVLAPLFKMLEAVFELFVPIVVSAIIDKGIANDDIAFILKCSVMLVFLAMIGLASSITAQYFSAKAAIGCATKLRYSVYEHILGLSFTDYDEVGTSTLITRLTSDINQIQNGVNLVLRLFLRSPFIVFGAMIMAFTINVKIALVFVVTIPVLAFIVFGIMLITRPMYRDVQNKLDKVLLTTRENLTGVRVIRAFNKQAKENVKFKAENEDLNKLQRVVGRISGLMNPLTYVVVNAAIVALIYFGAIKVNIGSMTQGQVVALYNYMSQILVELIKLANLIVTITKALACAGRVESVLAIESSMDFVEKRQELDLDENVSNNQPKLELRNASLCYKGNSEDSVSNINLVAKKGDMIGIIGGTGSGKTTVANLISRFYDATKGSVLIDGVDVKDIPREELVKKVSVCMQKAVLFSGTVRENLTMGRKDIPEEVLERAVEVSQSKEFLSKKEGYLDYMINQGAKNLSGGQKQRLNIARALSASPEILILDDCSSALDYATDAALRNAIVRDLKDVTTVIISQRAASLLNCTKIIVLDDGKMVGEGTHEELLENCEIYKEIYDSQFSSQAKVVGGAH